MKATDTIEKLQEMIDIQCSEGNWNYSEYMYGMANGMIYAKSVLTGENPAFLDKPETWLSDVRELDKFNKSGIVVNPTEALDNFNKSGIIVNIETDNERD